MNKIAAVNILVTQATELVDKEYAQKDLEEVNYSCGLPITEGCTCNIVKNENKCLEFKPVTL